MDERQIRSRLVRLYIITTALTLAVVFVATTLLSVREVRQKDREGFFVRFTAIAEKLQTEPSLRHSLLKEYEQENRMTFAATDSGLSLQYNSGDAPARSELLEKIRALALSEGLDITILPLTTQRRTSPIFQFQYDGKSYFGAASVIPIQNSFRTLVAAQEVNDGWNWRFGFYGIAYLISVLILSLVGIWLIDKALRPAMESRIRQTEFVAAASHELRSPLAVIQANAATVADMPDHSLAAAEAISAECARMSRLISDMLLLASADAKNWPVTLAPLEPDTLLLNVYEAYLPVCAKRGFRLELDLPEEPLPKIEGDAERLSQVLGILLDNAMNYSEAAAQKSITLAAQVQRERLFVNVIDHGAGIPDEQKPHIFDRFYRGDRSRKTKQHFGLGLAIAKELILLHNGRITVSATPGGGSTFTIIF